MNICIPFGAPPRTEKTLREQRRDDGNRIGVEPENLAVVMPSFELTISNGGELMLTRQVLSRDGGSSPKFFAVKKAGLDAQGAKIVGLGFELSSEKSAVGPDGPRIETGRF